MSVLEARGFSDYIVFVDESGDHSMASINAEWPLFVLSFCIFPVRAYVETATPAIRALKFATFGHDLVVLHEHDIRKRKGAFAQLNQEARETFMERLTELIAATDMTMIAVVIDKLKHRERYVTPHHPYHLAMQFGLERVADFLRLHGQRDRDTWIVFEARGSKEDQALELEFHRVCGGANRGKCTLPLRFMVADKKSNAEGLQLADLTARPAGLSVLRPDQPNRAWQVLQPKLFQGRRHCITGNGLKLFP